MTPHLIGLTGYAGAGKDLVAALLSMRGYTRMAFADAVREEAVTLIGQDAPAELDEDLRGMLSSGALSRLDFYSKPTLPAVRRILQQYGTEYRRGMDPRYWVNIVEEKIALTTSPIVISDVRFPNESAWIKARGGVLWRVLRPGLKSDGHVSESIHQAIKEDRMIGNDGDLQHLAANVRAALL